MVCAVKIMQNQLIKWFNYAYNAIAFKWIPQLMLEKQYFQVYGMLLIAM